MLHSALRTPIGPLVYSQLLVKIVGDMSRQTSPEDGGGVQSSVTSDQGNVYGK